MDSLNIFITSKKYNCTLSLSHKVSVLIGDSGRGKSNIPIALKDTSGAYKVNINKDIDIRVLEPNNWKYLLSADIDKLTLFVIDDYDFMFVNEFGSTFNKLKNCYLLLICKAYSSVSLIKRLSCISVDSNAIYEFIGNGIEHYNKPSIGENTIEGLNLKHYCI